FLFFNSNMARSTPRPRYQKTEPGAPAAASSAQSGSSPRRRCRGILPEIDRLKRLKRLDHGSDVTVLENRAAGLPLFGYYGAHHGPGQVVGANHLVGEQHPKHRVDPA